MVRAPIPACNRLPFQLLDRERASLLGQVVLGYPLLFGKETQSCIDIQLPVPTLLERRLRVSQLADSVTQIPRNKRLAFIEVHHASFVPQNSFETAVIQLSCQIGSDVRLRNAAAEQFHRRRSASVRTGYRYIKLSSA